jgi:hypothetical protein
VDITLPIKVEVKGKASSSYDEDMIDRRLAILKDRTDAAAEEERVVQRALKADLIPPGK